MTDLSSRTLWAQLREWLNRRRAPSQVKAFAMELAKEHGKRSPVRRGEDDAMIMLRLEDLSLLHRCDWKDKIDPDGRSLLHFAHQRGLPEDNGTQLIDGLDGDAPIDTLAQSLRSLLEEARLKLLQIDERSDGWLYAITGTGFAERWEMTRLSDIYAVTTPRSATARLPKGLHNGPRTCTTEVSA